RHEYRLLLAELISAKLQARTSDEWERILNENGVPCGPIYQMDQAMEHPQVHHREMVLERPHPTLGTVRLLGIPLKLAETPGAVYRVPPQLGEHTDEILRSIGVPDSELDRLPPSAAPPSRP